MSGLTPQKFLSAKLLLNNVKKLVDEIDKEALISISEAEEIKGRGFLKPAL
ncbi:DUF2179 domain-containing protein [Haloimpatiens lingqiaonensis]|uniref:DUF2179 domain-containing protein n=1 Tax=Haloimpatiens lingqiaonensis TaxID=1380675 RepID=UPI0010FDB448